MASSGILKHAMNHLTTAEQMRIYTYLFGLGFCIVLSFGQVADFILRRRARDLVAAIAFVAMAASFFFRILSYAQEEYITNAQIAAGLSYSSLITAIFAFVWGALRLWERHVLGITLHRLKQEEGNKEHES